MKKPDKLKEEMAVACNNIGGGNVATFDPLLRKDEKPKKKRSVTDILRRKPPQ